MNITIQQNNLLLNIYAVMVYQSCSILWFDLYDLTFDVAAHASVSDFFFVESQSIKRVHHKSSYIIMIV